MAISTFTKQQFEQVLPCDKTSGERLWFDLGLVHGEWSYLLRIDGRTGIQISSSVWAEGESAKTGDNSIRLWLVRYQGNPDGTVTTKPLGTKVDAYTTRVPGWHIRMIGKIRILWAWRKTAGDCPYCGEPRGIYRCKSGENKGRVFTKCFNHGDDFVKSNFRWLEEE